MQGTSHEDLLNERVGALHVTPKILAQIPRLMAREEPNEV
jgi:hypothetical protein